MWDFGLLDHYFCGEARLIDMLSGTSARAQRPISGISLTQISDPDDMRAARCLSRRVFRRYGREETSRSALPTLSDRLDSIVAFRGGDRP